MTGRPSTKIKFYRAPTPDFPLPLFLAGLILFSMLLLFGALLYTTFSALDSGIHFNTREQLALGMVGMVLPMLTTYLIVKGKSVSKWFAALQIVTSGVLFAHLAAEDYIGIVVPGYVSQLIYAFVLGAICYLFFSAQMRAYYRWLKGDESDVAWMSIGRLNLARKMEESDAAITSVLEVLFILLALGIFAFMLIPHFWK